MRFRSSALIAAALVLGFAAPAALVSPVRAQEEDEGARIEALLNEAMDHMTAGNGLLARAKTLTGADADRVKSEGSAAYDEACAKYSKILDLLNEVSGAEEMKAQVRGLAHYNTACARSLQGRKDDAITAFGLSLDAGFDDFDHIAKDTDLDPIRAEPRFVQLIERARAAASEETAAAAREALSSAAMFPYDFTVTTLDGQRLALADLRGKVVIVDFWGTWCPPCKAEIPHFVELKKEFGDKLAIVGMTWEQGKTGEAAINAIKEFALEAGINYPLTLITDRADLQKVPDLRGFPTTLFIDKQGRVRAKEVGYRDIAVLRGLIQALDAEAAPPAATTPAPAPQGGGLGPF